MKTRIGTMVALFLVCLAAVRNTGAGERTDKAPERVGAGGLETLQRRISALRKEHRLRLRAARLMSEATLFDEEAALARSISIPPLKDGRPPSRPPTLSGGPEVAAHTETTSIGRGGEWIRPSVTDLERVEEEMQVLDAKVQGLKRGREKP